MNSENNKTFHPYRSVLKLTNKINLTLTALGGTLYSTPVDFLTAVF